MNPKAFCRLAARLMRHPAAPYHENSVRQEVELICEREQLSCHRDRYGNILVRLVNGRPARPLVLAAHLDHPGFEIVRRLSPNRWLARFCGWVGDDYFRPGLRVRLMPGGIRGKLGRRGGKDKLFEVVTSEQLEQTPKFAVWDLEDFGVRGGRIYGRACDDLIGTAAVLATLIELKRTRCPLHVIGVLSRAEEVGFRGALAVAAAKAIPRDALVISLETSRELPGVNMGQGVILRVGDRSSVFDSKATRFLSEVAEELGRKRKGFRFQRGLMSGGTCEGTAYQEYGWQTAGVCVALGNYHNCAVGKTIAAEYVNVQDACDMVDLLVAGTKAMPVYKKLVDRLPARLEALWRESRQHLIRTAI